MEASCLICGLEADSTMFRLGEYQAHVPCVIRKLNELCDEEREDKLERCVDGCRYKECAGKHLKFALREYTFAGIVTIPQYSWYCDYKSPNL